MLLLLTISRNIIFRRGNSRSQLNGASRLLIMKSAVARLFLGEENEKLLLVASLVSVFAAANAMADVTASATASWDATATKDTTSMLVVTPLNSLTFQYAEGLNAFNTQDGAFDITIQGQESATDFELTAQVISNTLTNASGDASTLDVGVAGTVMHFPVLLKPFWLMPHQLLVWKV